MRQRMGSEGTKENCSVMSNCPNIQTDDTNIVNHTEAKHDSDFHAKDLLSTHCLVCDEALSSITENTHNIFGQLRKAGDSCARGSVFEKVGQVLNRALHSIKLHSELVCNKCFMLLIEHEEVRNRLQELQAQIEKKFTSNEKNHIEERKSKKKLSQRVVNESDESTAIEHSQKESIKEVALLMKKQGASKAKFVRMNKPYICSICGKLFRAFSHRVEHMLIHLDEKPWSCKECLKTFRTKSALRVHEAKHSGIKPYTCQHCSKSFLDRYYFEEHQRIHSGERPFACTFCARLFARKKDLSIHTKRHTGDKPYKCSLCTKTFAVKSRLDRHLKIHSGERPYSCEHCTKSFARSDDYQVHMRTHTGERPFKCGICDRTFTNKSNCLVHVRLHQGSVQKKELNKHLKMHKKGKSATETSTGDTVAVPNSQDVYLQTLEERGAVEEHSSFAQPPLLQVETVTHIPPLQSLPVAQVAHLEWGDITASATTTFVNITGTYVSIV